MSSESGVSINLSEAGGGDSYYVPTGPISVRPQRHYAAPVVKSDIYSNEDLLHTFYIDRGPAPECGRPVRATRRRGAAAAHEFQPVSTSFPLDWTRALSPLSSQCVYGGSSRSTSRAEIIADLQALATVPGSSPDTSSAASPSPKRRASDLSPPPRSRRGPPLRAVLRSPTGGRYRRKRACEMDADELERIREANRMTARRQRAKFKAEEEAVKQRLMELQDEQDRLEATRRTFQQQLSQLVRTAVQHVQKADANDTKAQLLRRLMTKTTSKARSKSTKSYFGQPQ